MRVFLVIPTIRNLHFLSRWGNQFKNTHLIIVEDNHQPTVSTGNTKFKSIHHFTWADIDNDLGKDAWIFSRKNAGIRSYGFYKAHQLDADTIITLDDDCFPVGDNFVSQHLDNLNFKAASDWSTTYPDPKWMYTRGVPYSIRNQTPVKVSHGLWSGALDLDGKTETKLPKLLNEKPYPPIRQIMSKNYYYPMCSMNLSFTSDVVPLMFFPMMGQDPQGNKWPYDRYDDIWAGVFSKKIMDHLNYAVINGSPYVNHQKKSLPKTNRTKESKGLKVNETLWQAVDKVKLTKKTPKTCYQELASKIKFPKDQYFEKLRQAMIIWAKLF